MKSIRVVALFLSVLILFQSCRVYQHRSVSLKTAYDKGRRVKIKTKDQQVYKFDRIVFEEDSFYGIKKKKRKLLKTALNPNELESVRMHNKTMSIIYGIGIGYVAALTIGLIIWSVNGSIGLGNVGF